MVKVGILLEVIIGLMVLKNSLIILLDNNTNLAILRGDSFDQCGFIWREWKDG